MSSWHTKENVYPNGTRQVVSSFRLAQGVSVSYSHVDGGFVIDRYRRNAKVYSDEHQIRRVVLNKLRHSLERWLCQTQTAFVEAANETKGARQ